MFSWNLYFVIQKDNFGIETNRYKQKIIILIQTRFSYIICLLFYVHILYVI